MTDLFKDVIPSILQTKNEVITEENEKDYLPFMVNRSLSFHYDCIFYANQMNMLPNTDKLMQYHFYLNSIRSYKRPFRKWLKKESSGDIESVKEYYKYSNEKAIEVLKILTDDDLKIIRKKLDKGGTKKK